MCSIFVSKNIISTEAGIEIKKYCKLRVRKFEVRVKTIELLGPG